MKMGRLNFLLVSCLAILCILPVNAYGNRYMLDNMDDTVKVRSIGNFAELSGTWEVTRITVEKNIDGKIETAAYNTAAEVKSPVPCAQEWKISAQNIVLRFPNGIMDTVENRFDSGMLSVLAYDGTQRTYLCSMEDGKLVLIATHNYVNILSGGQAEKVVEKWIITLNLIK